MEEEVDVGDNQEDVADDLDQQLLNSSTILQEDEKQEIDEEDDIDDGNDVVTTVDAEQLLDISELSNALNDSVIGNQKIINANIMWPVEDYKICIWQ